MIVPISVGQEVEIQTHPANFSGEIMSAEERALQPIHEGRAAVTKMIDAHTGSALCLEVNGSGARCTVTQLVTD